MGRGEDWLAFTICGVVTGDYLPQTGLSFLDTAVVPLSRPAEPC